MSNYKPQEFAEMIGVSVKPCNVGTKKANLKHIALQQIGVIILTNNMSIIWVMVIVNTAKRSYIQEYLLLIKR